MSQLLGSYNTPAGKTRSSKLIDKVINEVDPSIKAHFSSRGGYEDEEDTITLTVN